MAEGKKRREADAKAADSTAEFEAALARQQAAGEDRSEGEPASASDAAPGHEVSEVPEGVKDSTAEFEAALADAQEDRTYVLRLYVTGTTPRSRSAIENLRRIIEEHLHGRYRLEVIDIYQHPELAQQAQIVAAPTLVKQLPLPLRRFIGDLSDRERILAGLELQPAEPETEEDEP